MMDKLTATETEIEAIRAHQATARAEIWQICHGGVWRMCIPVQEDDSDRVFGQLCRDVDLLLARIDALERIIYECVVLADIMRTGVSEELYREIVAKFEKKAEEE